MIAILGIEELSEEDEHKELSKEDRTFLKSTSDHYPSSILSSQIFITPRHNPEVNTLTEITSGHNNYGEPAWPNDILYIFPVVILGLVSITLGLSLGEAVNIGVLSLLYVPVLLIAASFLENISKYQNPYFMRELLCI